MNYKKESIDMLKKYKERGIKVVLEIWGEDEYETFYNLLLTRKLDTEVFGYYLEEKVSFLDNDNNLEEDDELLNVILYEDDKIFDWLELYDTLMYVRDSINEKLENFNKIPIEDLGEYQILNYLKYKILTID